MTYYFMAGEMAGFSPSDASSTEQTDAGYYSTSFSRCAINAGEGAASQYIFTPDIGPLPDDCWYHFSFRRDTTGSDTHTLIALVDGATEVFRIRATGDAPDSGSAELQMQSKIAGVFTNIGSPVAVSNTSLQTIDLHLVGNSATGTATLYVAGTERESVTANLTTSTSINTARFYGINTASGCFISQFVVADVATIGGRLFTVPVDAIGTTGQWAGTYAEIDEITYTDSSYISSDTADQVSTFNVNSPTLTGYVIQGVAVYARVKKGASGPTQLQLALRVSGTDYFSASKALTTGYTSVGNIWETNPDTSAAWTNTPIASIQPGVKSIA